MTNNEFIKKLEYEERVMRELHGIKVAMPFKAALEAARAVVEGLKYDTVAHDCNCDYRATGSAPIVDDGRDGWKTY